MRYTALFLLIVWPVIAGLQAQPIAKATYETMLEVAAERYALHDYYNALEWYEKAYEEKRSEDLVPIIAELHFKLRDYVRAERWYARLLRRDSENEYADMRFTYGRLLKMNSKYEDAIEELERFINLTEVDSLKTLARNEITGAELALAVGEQSKGVTVDNAGRQVNSPFSEYSAIVSRDGQTLYFTGFDSQEVIVVDDESDAYHARVYRAGKEEEMEWGKPEPLGPEINRPGVHSTNVTLSPDGRYMYFTRAVLQGNVLAESKIYFSLGGDGSWGAATEVVGVNGDYIAKQPAVGELFGREVLFFSSDMEGGYGGFDIYYATARGDGVYGDPVNLGPVVNSVGDEETPFYRDGTLYYSSTGHPGLGGFDIFYSVWDGEKWSSPTNLGYGYNSSVDDLFLTLDDEGYKGFLVSNRPDGRSVHGRTCCNDIYQFSIARLYADLVVGVFDADRQVLKGATVQVVEMQEDQPGTTASKTSETGNRFDFGLELEMPYMIVASREGYYPDTAELNTVGLTESKTFEQRFYLEPKPVAPPEPEYDTITIEEPIVLENILYDFDSDRIRPEAESDLEFVYELMIKHPEMVIELSSHTDYRGDDYYNEDLSQRRAESARRWLMRKGLERDRIAVKGYGESVPQRVNEPTAAAFDFLEQGDLLTQTFIDSLDTEEQREVAHEINRRTEFKIIEGPTSVIIKRARLKKKTDQNGGPNRNLLPQERKDTFKISPMSTLHGKKNLKGVPLMHFDDRTVHLGTVRQGEKRRHVYEFTNRGDTELRISIVSACDCTTVDYSTSPVAPGESGQIAIVFDSAEKEVGETINIDIFLDNVDPETGHPIIEQIQYTFDIE